MDRSLGPTKVEFRSGDVQNTESTKAFHILQRLVDSAQPGVVTGLTVSQNSTNNTRFDVLAGSGYAPNGELVELLESLTAQSPGSLTAGESVLVGLMYLEVTSTNGAAETDGVARPRRAERSSALRVFTTDEWQALPSTFPDYTLDAQDRFLICAVVGLPSPATSTTVLDIALPPTFSILKTIEQPVNVTGVVVTAVSLATLNSNPFPYPGTATDAQLLFEPGTNLLAYGSPFDVTNLGAASPFNVAGLGTAFDVSTLAIAGGTATLTSANGTDTITVLIDRAMLPTETVATASDALAVSTVYAPAAVRHSARDDYHRHLLGAQLPQVNNPHGLRLSDIAASIESLIGALTLGTGYATTLAQAEVPRLLFPRNAAVEGAINLAFQHLMTTLGLNGRTRFYEAGGPAGATGFLVTVNARVRNEGNNATIERLVANGDLAATRSLGLRVEKDTVTLSIRDAADADTWTATTWSRAVVLLDLTNNQTTFDGRLVVGSGLHTAVGRALARVTTDYADGGSDDIRTLIWQSSKTPDVTLGAILRVYRRSSPSGRVYDGIELVYNAAWDGTTGMWIKDDSDGSSKVLFNRVSACAFLYRTAGAAASTFTDVIEVGGWDAASEGYFNLATGSLKLAGTYQYVARKAYTQSIIGGTAAYTSLLSTVYNDISVGLPIFTNTGGADTWFGSWGLKLPQGAIITGGGIHGNFTNAAAGSIRGKIVRAARASGTLLPLRTGGTVYDTIGDVTNTTMALTADVAEADRTVDNTLYSYFIQLYNAAGADAIVIWNVFATYELPTVASA